MGQVNITINGRSFGISCEDGQEQRVTDLGHYVDSRLKDIARAGAASNESHLLVLTTLLLADELFETRESGAAGAPPPQAPQANPQEEALVVHAIEDLAERIDRIAGRIQAA